MSSLAFALDQYTTASQIGPRIMIANNTFFVSHFWCWRLILIAPENQSGSYSWDEREVGTKQKTKLEGSLFAVVSHIIHSSLLPPDKLPPPWYVPFLFYYLHPFLILYSCASLPLFFFSSWFCWKMSILFYDTTPLLASVESPFLDGEEGRGLNRIYSVFFLLGQLVMSLCFSSLFLFRLLTCMK